MKFLILWLNVLATGVEFDHGKKIHLLSTCLVCYTAVFSGEERCVTTLKTAV